MSIYKNIFWRLDMEEKNPNQMFAHVHYLVGYNQGCISDYIDMAKELRQTFPKAKNKDLGCHKVRKSTFCYGFTLLTWNHTIDLDDNMKKLLSKCGKSEEERKIYLNGKLNSRYGDKSVSSNLYKGWQQFIHNPEYYW